MGINFLIYGFGGHGKVIAEAIISKTGSVVGVFDDQPIEIFEKIIYLGPYDSELFSNIPIIIGIGNNEVRRTVSNIIKHDFLSFIHPSAQVAGSVKIGKGSVILQNAVIQSNTVIGNHVIVNIGSMIDHDNTIEDFVHVSPLCYVGSNSIISELTSLEPCSRVSRFSQI